MNIHESPNESNAQRENPLLSAALARAAEGWAVHPLWGIVTRGGVRQCECPLGARCEKPGKKPRLEGWKEKATRNAQQIRAWWKLYPHANIGAHTGKKSGRNVLDEDPQKGGTISRELLETEHGALPDTQQTITGGDGIHWHFIYDGPLTNSVSSLGPGLDIRSDGGNLVLPGSLHISGRVYEYEATHGPDDIALAPMPAWLRAKLIAQSNGHHKVHVEGEPIENGHRNDTLFRLACSMRARGCSRATVLSALRAENETRCKPPLADREVEKIADSSSKYEPGASGSTPSSAGALPQIVVNNRHLRDLLDEALVALKEKNDPPVLFERSSLLVRVQRDERNQPFISTVSEPVLRESLTRCADFVKTVGSKEGGKNISVSPPRDVIQTLHARGGWQLPPLVGLCECPVLRPDGTVLSAPGYDPATMLFYDPVPGLSMTALLATPTQAHAQESARLLLSELLVDFPFCEPADKANMLACLLTPIVRPAIRGCVPLCLIDKPGPGSGATLLADVVATVTTGVHAAKEMLPTGRNSEEEMRKRITSLLIAAKDVVVLDNVENALASSALSAVLTTPLWQDRVLSKNEIITLPVRTTWIATANNIVIRGDIGRRSYRVRIDPKQDRPWTRDGFRHADLLTWTREHRGELLHALLTMSRAWFAAGQPKVKTPKIGGFEKWVEIVGGILAYARVEGFLGNLEELYSTVDEDAQQWRVFIETWHEHLGEQSYTVAEFAGFAAENPALMEALPDVIDWDDEKFESSKKKLGKALKKRIDRYFGEYRLEQDRDDAHAKVARWCVKKCGVCGV